MHKCLTGSNKVCSYEACVCFIMVSKLTFYSFLCSFECGVSWRRSANCHRWKNNFCLRSVQSRSESESYFLFCLHKCCNCVYVLFRIFCSDFQCKLWKCMNVLTDFTMWREIIFSSVCSTVLCCVWSIYSCTLPEHSGSKLGGTATINQAISYDINCHLFWSSSNWVE